ncbi:MAG: hypothetical protein H6Q33_994 [Deltaproteobacteria bacterium]|nr:hypothetical protein [Deltaproteobacteria bacterium]
MIAAARSGLVCLLVLCGLTGAAAAQESLATETSEPRTRGVEIHIGAVLASNSGQEFDQRLASMQRQFNALFAYSSYRLVKEQRQQVAWGERVAFDIPGGRYMVVIPKEFKNDRVLMKVMLIEGTRPIIDTALSLRDHATFLVGGPRERNGVLILSIGATAIR